MNTISVPDEVVMSKIYVIREQKVMLDEDLAELYSVETRRLNG
ncbi:ORF6N domain-containing protein [Pedobacter nototheniae]|nr:ORF6N domain-containing protein [Pedobacter nototheniae]